MNRKIIIRVRSPSEVRRNPENPTLCRKEIRKAFRLTYTHKLPAHHRVTQPKNPRNSTESRRTLAKIPFGLPLEGLLSLLTSFNVQHLREILQYGGNVHGHLAIFFGKLSPPY